MKECQACQRCFSDDINHCPDDGQKLVISLRGAPLLEGRYQLERRLGDGGMGIVYKGHHTYLKTTHAIKVILPDLVGHDPQFSSRFRQEAMIAASIRHPNIVLVTDFGVAHDVLPFLVMEFIKGRSLQDVFLKKKALPIEMALQIMTAVGAGVSAAHKNGIIHRDLKPLNIMLKDDLPIIEGVKILDFGLAKMRSSEGFGSFVQVKTTGLMGSPYYMAPEQWSEVELDSRADIYSLGIILFQMLAGEVPFKGSSMPTVMHSHLMLEPPTFSELGIHIPPPIENVVRHALEKKPENRPATVDEFVNELREASVSIELTKLAETAMQTQPIPQLDEANSTLILDHTYTFGPTVASQEDSRSAIQEEAERLAREFEDAQLRAEEARKRAEDASRRRIEEEAAVKRADEEAARKRAKEAELRRREEKEAHRRLALEAARKLIEEDEARNAAEAEALRVAAEETERQRVKEAAERMAREIDVLQLRAEEARLQAEEEARKRSEEVLARKLAEEKAEKLLREVEEAQRRAEEARMLAEKEARQRAEEDLLRKQVEEEKAHKRAGEEALRFAEVDAARLQAKEEADRLAREVQEAQRRSEEARMRTEEEARKRIEEEAARKRAEDEARRLAKEVDEARKRVELARERQAEEEALAQRTRDDAARKQIEEELQRRAEEVAKKWAQEEATRRLAEEEAAQKRAEENAQRLAEQESARRRAEEEASRLTREIEAAEGRAREALSRAESEALARAEENELRRADEEASRVRAKEEADRLAREVHEAQLRAREARLQAEEEVRKRSEEATARKLAEEKAESLQREVQKAQRRAEEARKRVEEAARLQEERERSRNALEDAARKKEEEHRQKLLEEIKLLEAEKRQREEAIRAAELEARSMAQRHETLLLTEDAPAVGLSKTPAQISMGRDSGGHMGVLPPGVSTGKDLQTHITATTFSKTAAESVPKKSMALRLLPLIILFIAIGGAGVGYVIFKLTRKQTVVNHPPVIEPAEFVFIPGGAFHMGRDDVPLDSVDQLNQRPTHLVSVKQFYLQKTEVTNEQYAEFVQATKYVAPSDWKGANRPPTGHEQWPVANVSQEDAIAYATWLSQKEKVTYRLPTEEEWEYAARGGSKDYLYPWGDQWFDDRANLGSGAATDSPKPVGSYLQGATTFGALDMIGNVWEWTSSEASFYPGINVPVKESERHWIVTRGGSYLSMGANATKQRRQKEFPATYRQWFKKDVKYSFLGFRLVKAAP